MLNVDASFLSCNNTERVGVVVRDHDGKVLETFTKFISYVHDVLLVELNAIEEGVILTTNKGSNNFFIMFDSQNAVAAIHNFPKYCSDLDPLLSSIVNLLPRVCFEGFYI